MTITTALVHYFYIGINIQDILYGVELALYFKTIHILLANKGPYKKSNLFYALFSSMMVFLITVWIVSRAIFGDNMWLRHSDYPGGAVAYWQANGGAWYTDWAVTTIIVLQLMTDALMIYRCRIIWNSYRIIVVPIILWFATLTLGILVIWISSSTGSDFYTGIPSRFCLGYWTVSVFLNTTLTCMICYRVVRHGRKVQEHLGQEYASLYFAVAAIVIESVLPYTLSGIAFLVALGVDSATAAMFIRMYLLTMCISPQMLILRVVTGRAWRNDTFSRSHSAIRFSPEDISELGSRWPDSSGTEAHVQTLPDVYLSDERSDGKISEV